MIIVDAVLDHRVWIVDLINGVLIVIVDYGPGLWFGG